MDTKLLDYMNKYEDNITAFTNEEARDFIYLLRKQKNYTKAIEVAEAIQINCRNVSGYENEYAWALYHQFMNDETATNNPDLFNRIASQIISMSYQEDYTPYEATINRLVKVEMTSDEPNYRKVLELLNKLDPKLISKDEFVTRDGNKFESPYERYMRQKAEAQFNLSKYQECVRTIEDAYASIRNFHGRHLVDLKNMHVECQINLKNYEQALKEYLMLGKQASASSASVYKMFSAMNQTEKANAFLVYDLLTGYDKENINLYENLKEAALQANYPQLAKKAGKLVEAIQQDDTQAETYFDDAIDELLRHLDRLVTRTEGKITSYNEEKGFGTIAAEGDRVFFFASDYIYDEEIKRFDIVEFTELPTYDRKRNEVSTKAILITFEAEDDYNM